MDTTTTVRSNAIDWGTTTTTTNWTRWDGLRSANLYATYDPLWDSRKYEFTAERTNKVKINPDGSCIIEFGNCSTGLIVLLSSNALEELQDLLGGKLEAVSYDEFVEFFQQD